MRRLLALVLCLLLPLQGVAAAQVPAPPCPMHGWMAVEGDSSGGTGTLVADMGDCCNDLASFERTGQPCKSAQNCGAPVTGMLPFQPMTFPSQVDPGPRAPAWRSPPEGSTSRLWRPPTSV